MLSLISRYIVLSSIYFLRNSNRMLKTRPFIVATLLARNEEDIVHHNIHHHIRQGVRHFVVTDNGSTDKTRKLMNSFPEVKFLFDEPIHNHNQSKWVTRMTRKAEEFNPEWIIHLDADEFWCGLNSLKGLDEEVFQVPTFHHHLPHSDGFELMEHYLTGNAICQIGLPNTMPKVVHRPNKNFVISYGNHEVLNVKMKPLYSISIHHFSVRTYQQFENKVIQGTLAIQAFSNTKISSHWRRWYKSYLEGNLFKIYQKMIEFNKEGLSRWMPINNNQTR